MGKPLTYLPITELLEEIVDNRGKTVPTATEGTPLIATNCIKHSSIYPTFEKVRYVDDETMKTWFRAHLQPNDILFVNKGTPGRVCLVPDPVNFCVAQDMMGFRCDKNKINYKYLFAVLRSDEIQKTIENNHVGLVIPHFRKQDLPSLMIPMRSPEEQEAIGDLYITLSEKIELNQRINAELESMAKTLYDYWFVQFDFPNENGKPYKSAGGKMVWNEELKREIPLGWEVKSLADITDVSTEQLNPMDFPNKDFKHYSIPAFDETGTYKIEKGEEIKSNKFSIKDTDVLVSKLNPWFSRVIYSTDDEDLISSTEFVVWRTNNTAIKNYLYMIARDYSFIAYCTQSASGTSNSHKRVNPTVMMKYQVVFDKETAERFGTILGSTIKMYAKNKVESQTLTELRDWLLPMLMNGQVRV